MSCGPSVCVCVWHWVPPPPPLSSLHSQLVLPPHSLGSPLVVWYFFCELYLRCVVRCASVLARVCLLFWKTFAPAKWTEATTVRSVDTVEKKSASVREQPF